MDQTRSSYTRLGQFEMVGGMGDALCYFDTKTCTDKGLKRAIQNTVVQSIELQGNRGGTGKSRQNSSGTGIAKFAGAAPLITVQIYCHNRDGPS